MMKCLFVICCVFGAVFSLPQSGYYNNYNNQHYIPGSHYSNRIDYPNQVGSDSPYYSRPAVGTISYGNYHNGYGQPYGTYDNTVNGQPYGIYNNGYRHVSGANGYGHDGYGNTDYNGYNNNYRK